MFNNIYFFIEFLQDVWSSKTKNIFLFFFSFLGIYVCGWVLTNESYHVFLGISGLPPFDFFLIPIFLPFLPNLNHTTPPSPTTEQSVGRNLSLWRLYGIESSYKFFSYERNKHLLVAYVFFFFFFPRKILLQEKEFHTPKTCRGLQRASHTTSFKV